MLPHQDLHAVTPLVDEHEDVAAEWVEIELLAGDGAEPVELPAEVDRVASNEDARGLRDAQHVPPELRGLAAELPRRSRRERGLRGGGCRGQARCASRGQVVLARCKRPPRDEARRTTVVTKARCATPASRGYSESPRGSQSDGKGTRRTRRCDHARRAGERSPRANERVGGRDGGRCGLMASGHGPLRRRLNPGGVLGTVTEPPLRHGQPASISPDMAAAAISLARTR